MNIDKAEKAEFVDPRHQLLLNDLKNLVKRKVEVEAEKKASAQAYSDEIKDLDMQIRFTLAAIKNIESGQIDLFSREKRDEIINNTANIFNEEMEARGSDTRVEVGK